MNNNYNGNNLPNQGFNQPQPQQTPPNYQQVPPNYYQQPYPAGYYNGYTPPNYNKNYPQKQPYAQAAENALGTMHKVPFLLMSLLFGLLCSRSLLIAETGVGMSVLGLAFYVLFLPFILGRGKKVPLSAWLLLIPEAAIFVSFSFYSGVPYTFLSLLAVFAIAMCQTTLMSGCTTGRPFTLTLVRDVCSTYLAYPFMNLGRTFSAIFSGKKNKKQGEMSATAKIGIGLVISIPVILILLCIFSSADKIFAMMVVNFIEALNLSLGRIICDLILTTIAMLYIMPLVVTLRAGYTPVKETKAKDINEKRPLDAIIVTTVLFAASVIYLLFVAVQSRYLFFVDGLPQEMTYAEYCRSGFLELVFVIALTTLVIALTYTFTRHDQNDRLPVYTKAALLLITAFDLVMTVSAVLRLKTYIEVYDMTVARFNAAVLIAFMVICLVVMALKIIFDKLRISAVIGGAAVIMLALYSLFNVDGFVAKYNVDKYLEGNGSSKIDIDYLQSLSVAAIPELERLMTSDDVDKTVKQDSRETIAAIAYYSNLFEGDNNHIGRWSLDRQRAVNVLEKHNITEKDLSWYYHDCSYDYTYDYDYDNNYDYGNNYDCDYYYDYDNDFYYTY